MAYIIDIIRGEIEPRPNRISLERYLIESDYITKYLSRIVRTNALSVYHVLFHLTYFNTGKGEIIIPWAKVGSYILSEQGNIIDSGTTVKRRIGDLLSNKCITVNQQRGGANEIIVHLPSDIPSVADLIKKEDAIEIKEEQDNLDYHTDSERRLVILESWIRIQLNFYKVITGSS